MQHSSQDQPVKVNRPFARLKIGSAEFIAFLFVLALGLCLRFADLKDQPLDFHPMRQLRGAILARNLYYQMLPNPDPELAHRAADAASMIEPQEPPFLEGLVALTYRLSGGERLWVARIYSILFWLAAGLIFFDLARRMTSMRGALITWAYFWLLPFSVVVSRVFQPEPFLVMWIAITLWTAYRWGETHSWRWGAAVGILAGWTLLVKITAIFYLAPALAMILLTHWSLRQALRDRWVWLVAVFSGMIPAVYYLGVIGGAAAGWFSGWGLGFTGLLLQPGFYVTWLKYLDYLLELPLLGAGLLGLSLLPRTKDRLLLLSLWLGYLGFGLTFPYPIRTHEYYSIMMIPIVALSLAALGEVILGAWQRQPPLWRWFALGAAVMILLYSSWLTYTGLIGVNYANEPIAWQKMGEELPAGKIVGLTHDYGYRIAYYGMRRVFTWPTSADFAMLGQRNQGYAPDFDALFAERLTGMDYFLVTLMGELDAQPELKEYLYQNFPIYAEGDGYLLFDLRHPLTPQP